MLIGLKLEIGFSQDENYRRLYGQRDILPFLRELGVEVAETPVGPETRPDALREHVARCVGVGMQVTMHPYSEGSVFNPAYFSDSSDNPCRLLHERFLSQAAEAAQRQQAPTLVNVHGAAGPSAVSRRHLVERSVAFFAWARDWCRRHAPEVAVAVELQLRPETHEARHRIGDRYDELLEVATQCDVPACWDFGHAYWNTHNHGCPIHPPEILLRRIGHVHCHDVHGGCDHQPLIHDVVTWRDFLKRLIDHGYDERIILEVPTFAFLDAGGIETVSASLQALRAWLQHCKPAPSPS